MKNTAKSVKTKIKYLFLRLMIFSLIVLVCGCSDSADVETRTEESESIELSPTAGGSIGIFSYNPDTLCPIFSNVSANIQMLNLVFDSPALPRTGIPRTAAEYGRFTFAAEYIGTTAATLPPTT